jgi:hypothetical protein
MDNDRPQPQGAMLSASGRKHVFVASHAYARKAKACHPTHRAHREPVDQSKFWPALPLLASKHPVRHRMRPPATAGRSSPTDTTSLDTRRVSIARHCARKYVAVKQPCSCNYILCPHRWKSFPDSHSSHAGEQRLTFRKHDGCTAITTFFERSTAVA